MYWMTITIRIKIYLGSQWGLMKRKLWHTMLTPNQTDIFAEPWVFDEEEFLEPPQDLDRAGCQRQTISATLVIGEGWCTECASTYLGLANARHAEYITALYCRRLTCSVPKATWKWVQSWNLITWRGVLWLWSWSRYRYSTVEYLDSTFLHDILTIPVCLDWDIFLEMTTGSLKWWKSDRLSTDSYLY